MMICNPFSKLAANHRRGLFLACAAVGFWFAPAIAEDHPDRPKAPPGGLPGERGREPDIETERKKIAEERRKLEREEEELGGPSTAELYRRSRDFRSPSQAAQEVVAALLRLRSTSPDAVSFEEIARAEKRVKEFDEKAEKQESVAAALRTRRSRLQAQKMELIRRESELTTGQFRQRFSNPGPGQPPFGFPGGHMPPGGGPMPPGGAPLAKPVPPVPPTPPDPRVAELEKKMDRLEKILDELRHELKKRPSK